MHRKIISIICRVWERVAGVPAVLRIDSRAECRVREGYGRVRDGYGRVRECGRAFLYFIPFFWELISERVCYKSGANPPYYTTTMGGHSQVRSGGGVSLLVA